MSVTCLPSKKQKQKQKTPVVGIGKIRQEVGGSGVRMKNMNDSHRMKEKEENTGWAVTTRS